jgi:hypothetical protein
MSAHLENSHVSTPKRSHHKAKWVVKPEQPQVRQRKLTNLADLKDVTVLDKDGGLRTAHLQELISSHVGTIHNTLVTPRVARVLLEINTRNRKVSERRVQYFRTVIEQDRWINTCEPVIIASNRTLSEGQHRLHGLVKADRAVLMDICFGAPEDAFWVTGTGAARSSADALSIIGIGRPTSVAAVARVLRWYERGEESLHSKVDNDEMIITAARWPDLEYAVTFQRDRVKESKLRNAAIGAFVFLALRQKNEEIVGQFLDLLRTGLGLRSEDHPLYQLRKRLLDDPLLAANKPYDVYRKLALTVKAWNLWLDNGTCKRLMWPGPGEKFPVMAGVSLDQPK